MASRINLAGWYTRIRGSKTFLLGLLSFIGVWVTLHFLFRFDRDWGALNLILSSEASIALAFFTMMSERQEAAQRRLDKHMLRILTAMHKLLKSRIEELEKE